MRPLRRFGSISLSVLGFQPNELQALGASKLPVVQWQLVVGARGMACSAKGRRFAPATCATDSRIRLRCLSGCAVTERLRTRGPCHGLVPTRCTLDRSLPDLVP